MLDPIEIHRLNHLDTTTEPLPAADRGWIGALARRGDLSTAEAALVHRLRTRGTAERDATRAERTDPSPADLANAEARRAAGAERARAANAERARQSIGLTPNGLV